MISSMFSIRHYRRSRQRQRDEVLFGPQRPVSIFNHMSPYEPYEFPGPFLEADLADLIWCNSKENSGVPAGIERLSPKRASFPIRRRRSLIGSRARLRHAYRVCCRCLTTFHPNCAPPSLFFVCAASRSCGSANPISSAE